LLEIFFLVILFLTFAEFSPTKNCNSDYNEYFSKKFAMQENVDLFSCFDIFTSWHTYARKSFTPYFKSSYSLLYTHYSILPLPRPNTSYPLTLYLLFYAPLLLHTYLSTAHFPQLHFHHPVSPRTGKWFNIGGSVLTTIYLLPTHYHQNISPNIFPFKDPPCVLEIFL